jgi:hypothetical protein
MYHESGSISGSQYDGSGALRIISSDFGGFSQTDMAPCSHRLLLIVLPPSMKSLPSSRRPRLTLTASDLAFDPGAIRLPLLPSPSAHHRRPTARDRYVEFSHLRERHCPSGNAPGKWECSLRHGAETPRLESLLRSPIASANEFR